MEILSKNNLPNTNYVRSEDYKAFDFEIPNILLNFIIEKEEVIVKTELKIKKINQNVNKISLDGVNVILKKLYIDEKLLNENDYKKSNEKIIINLTDKENFIIKIEGIIKPWENLSLIGMYESNGIITTQCEAEGFRRITYYPDRPDILSKYKVRIEASKIDYPLLLSNGNITKKNTLKNLINSLAKIKDFSLASPINDNPKIPNYKSFTVNQNDSNILSVDSIDGFSMLFNLKNFPDKIFFDENFFLYLENDDLCLRIKKENHNIFIIKNSQINHKGSISRNADLELLRNWHWMWSKYYFNKKHYGTLIALIKVSPNFLSAIFKYLINLVIFNNYKRKIYKMRILGLYNSIIGKKSWYRLK